MPDWSDATLGGALVALVAAVSCAGALAACAGALVSCAGAIAFCAGAAEAEGAGCAGVGSAGGAEVIACDEDDALGSDGVAAAVAESAVESLVARVRAALRSLRVDVATLFFERDDFSLEAAIDSVFFSGLLAFAGGAGGVDFSAGALAALGSALPGATAVSEELVELVSATLGVVEAAVLAGVALATMVIEPTCRSNTYAPPITIATIAANAIPKCLTWISLRDVMCFGIANRARSCGDRVRSGENLHARWTSSDSRHHQTGEPSFFVKCQWPSSPRWHFRSTSG